jgi:hypothetical protein
LRGRLTLKLVHSISYLLPLYAVLLSSTDLKRFVAMPFTSVGGPTDGGQALSRARQPADGASVAERRQHTCRTSLLLANRSRADSGVAGGAFPRTMLPKAVHRKSAAEEGQGGGRGASVAQTRADSPSRSASRPVVSCPVPPSSLRGRLSHEVSRTASKGEGGGRLCRC